MNMAVNLGAGDPENFYYRGLVHGALGNHVSAIEDYSRAIALKPGYLAALYARALAALGAGNAKMARADALKVLELDPAHGGAARVIKTLEEPPVR